MSKEDGKFFKFSIELRQRQTLSCKTLTRTRLLVDGLGGKIPAICTLTATLEASERVGDGDAVLVLFALVRSSCALVRLSLRK